ncbi:NADH dehydrogenase[ubiquinone] iron-sulfur protein 3, mitochondrial-like protein [Euroglyphus maynei]|uniref:NADH dehydrogenase [ubiquinone] iron-sulfur protein 4, mitochondrial n=1 Tax=Euroglyphus maynei TaxID=6958 RepID=A0A1Y3AQA5_EURMA|nr:NADH dehydrogenase[ubiquinone] iron-sulfur protein 3, mitochondrial-like protein [Euroglyphus maynei]
MAFRQLIGSTWQKLHANESRFLLATLQRYKSSTKDRFLDGDCEDNSIVLADPEKVSRIESLRNSYINIEEPNTLSNISGIPAEHVQNRRVRIYKPAKNAMQSGTFDTQKWKLDFENRARWENPLIGWTSTGDPNSNLNLWFSTKDDAIDYCERNGYHYEVDETHERRKLRKTYAENFSWNKRTRVGSK